MKWITRKNVKVDRVACPWLIKKFVDAEAEFLFVPADQVTAIVASDNAIPYDCPNVELGHHGKECSFEAILRKYDLMSNPALRLLGRIVNGADTDNTLYNQAEGWGLEAVAEGFRHLGYKDDHALNAAEWLVYDALYAYCQEMIRRGKPLGQFAKDTVLFLCPHNAAKSVFAVAYFDRAAKALGLPYRADSAGTEPDAAPAPKVVAHLQREGIDISTHQPRLVTAKDLSRALRVVSMGCANDTLPAHDANVEMWNIPAVSADLPVARAAILAHVDVLIGELQAGFAA